MTATQIQAVPYLEYEGGQLRLLPGITEAVKDIGNVLVLSALPRRGLLSSLQQGEWIKSAMCHNLGLVQLAGSLECLENASSSKMQGIEAS